MTTLSGNVSTALAAEVMRPARFVEIVFPDQTKRYWSGLGNKTMGGNAYEGVGNLGSVEIIPETSTDGLSAFSSDRVQLTLSGLSSVSVAETFNSLHQGSQVTITDAVLDATGTIIDDPFVSFLGQIDTMNVVYGQYVTVTAICENFISFLFHGVDGHLRSNADQQSIFSGDLFCSFADTLPLTIPWAQPTQNPNGNTLIGALQHMAGV